MRWTGSWRTSRQHPFSNPSGGTDGRATAEGRPDFAEQWVRRVLSPRAITRAERDVVAGAFRRCYRSAGLSRPVIVLWHPTPEAAQPLLDSTDLRLDTVLAAAPWLRRRLRIRAYLDRPMAALLFFAIGAWAVVCMMFAVYGIASTGGFSICFGLALIALAQWSARQPRQHATVSARRLKITLAVLRGTGIALVIGPVMVRGARGESLLSTGPLLPRLWLVAVTAAVALLVGAVAGVLGWRSASVWDSHRRALLVMRVDQQIVAGATSGLGQPFASRLAPAVSPESSFRSGLNERLAIADPLAGWLPRPLPLHRLAELVYRVEVLPVPAHRGIIGALPGRSSRRSTRRTLRAHEMAAQISWIPFGRLVIAVDPPLRVRSGPTGPHCVDGPAVEWSDGSLWYALNGVRLPRCPAGADWTVEEIHAVNNSETRRAMIEAIGWEKYIQRADLTLLATAADPGNPPHTLELYDLPIQHYVGVQLLMMTNGSRDRSGDLRRYAELVPEMFDDPVEAAAWQYGVTADVYQRMERRT